MRSRYLRPTTCDNIWERKFNGFINQKNKIAIDFERILLKEKCQLPFLYHLNLQTLKYYSIDDVKVDNIVPFRRYLFDV